MTINTTAQKTRPPSTTVLLFAGFGGVLFIAAFVVLGFVVPGYSPVHDTISAIELTPIGITQQINFLVFGLLSCLFSVGLRRELQQGFGSLLIPLIQFIDGLGVIGDAIFIHGMPHFVFDLVAFNAALCVLFLFAWRFRRDPRWQGWSAYSILTAIAMMALLFAFGFANHLGGPAGLLEKLATGVRTIWSAVLVARLLSGASLTYAQVRQGPAQP